MKDIEFTRDAYRGLDLEWFAVDRQGAIAILTTGYGDIPRAVFESQEKHRRLVDFFASRPEASEARAVDRPAGWPGADLNLQEARRGLYSYDHTSYSTLDPYELIAQPVTPLALAALPDEIRTLLRPFHFERLEFDTTPRILVQEHLDCAE
ncbi:MAG: hypothetical protein ACRDG5_02590 [Anaerolineales bacterium]